MRYAISVCLPEGRLIKAIRSFQNWLGRGRSVRLRRRMKEATARRSQGRWSAPTGGGGGKGSESRGRTRARLPGPRAPAREGRVQRQVSGCGGGRPPGIGGLSLEPSISPRPNGYSRQRQVSHPGLQPPESADSLGPPGPRSSCYLPGLWSLARSSALEGRRVQPGRPRRKLGNLAAVSRGARGR